jgi:hypothetical protein
MRARKWRGRRRRCSVLIAAMGAMANEKNCANGRGKGMCWQLAQYGIGIGMKANTCIQLPTSEGEKWSKKMEERNEGDSCWRLVGIIFSHFANLTKTTKIAAA